VDVATIEGTENIVSFADKLADFIVQTNISYEYANMRTESKINCQDFVDLFFNYHNITPQFCKPVVRYLATLRSKGKSKMKFQYDEAFKEHFKLSGNKKVFESHHEIDEFVLNLDSLDPDFRENWPEEYQLLKSFDRAMWMRSFAIDRYRNVINLQLSTNNVPADEKPKVEEDLKKLEHDKKHKMYRPLTTMCTDGDDTTENVMCPFGDPRVSSSYAINPRYFDE
jgi:hypothetical protein